MKSIKTINLLDIIDAVVFSERNNNNGNFFYGLTAEVFIFNVLEDY